MKKFSPTGDFAKWLHFEKMHKKQGKIPPTDFGKI
jgi:hypothetical protein